MKAKANRAFEKEIAALYRDGSHELAEASEREGAVEIIPRARQAYEWIAGHPIVGSGAHGCTDSPIETKLAGEIALLCRRHPYRNNIKFISHAGLQVIQAVRDAERIADARDLEKIFVYPQVRIASYRVDFMVINTLRSESNFIVECDGHAYHSTKEAIGRDRKRDRILQACGLRVIRFTGSEIHHDADECAKFVLALACGYIGRQGAH